MKPGETRMLDWRGQEIKVGDVVVYPVRHSSSMWLVEAEVVELHSMVEDRRQTGYNEPGRMVPTQVGGATVKRLREQDEDQIKPKLVKVGLDRLTIVIPAEVMEFARYPMRYMVGPEDPDESAGEYSPGPDGIWTIGPNAEIDGRAS